MKIYVNEFHVPSESEKKVSLVEENHQLSEQIKDTALTLHSPLFFIFTYWAL